MSFSPGNACSLLIVILILPVSLSDVVVIPVQVVSGTIEEISGSMTNMGCRGPENVSDGTTICGTRSDGFISYLIDGISPDINTNNSNWASQLVTVRGNMENANIPEPHVLLTFGFDTPVSVTGIEIDLFNCPDWNIGATSVFTYFSTQYNLTFDTTTSGESVQANSPPQSCNSLSTVAIMRSAVSYRTIHIVLSQGNSPIEYVYIGEVRFINGNKNTIKFQEFSTSRAFNPTATSLLSTLSTVAPPVTSSSTPTTPSGSPDEQESNDSTVLIAVAAIIAVVVIALLVVLIIILVVARQRRTSQAKLEALQDVVREGGDGEVELKNVDREAEYFADNPLYSETTPVNGRQTTPGAELEPPYYNTGDNKGTKVADNPHYYTTPVDPVPSPSVDNDLYTVVDENKLSHKQAPATENRLYASVTESKSPSPAPPTDPQPVYAMVDKSNRSKGQKPSEIGNTTADDEDFTSPSIPPKSPDLQAYLSTQEVVSHPLPLPPSANQPSKVTTLPKPLASGMSSNPNYESADDALSQQDAGLYAVPDVPRSTQDTIQKKTSPDDEDIYSEPSIEVAHFIQSSKKEQAELPVEQSTPRIYTSIYSVAATKEKEEPPLQISRSNIEEIKELGLGQFGKVILAQTVGLSLSDLHMNNDTNRDITIYVAVKKLRSNANHSERETFNKEIKFMSRLNHPNVVRFLGVCYESPAFIIMEYMEHGDLSLFLQRYTEICDIPTNTGQIPTTSVTKMALQVACAMKYLASKNFVHRDLASRNCLVDENFTVKLADFGMSRNLYESHYYKIKGNAILPIRWMATECFYGVFSEKTDVWAFGITMWELFTLAKDKPYPHLADGEVVNDAVNKDGNRYIHPRPPPCPEAVYDVMLKCWNTNRKKRAKFDDIYDMLAKLVST